MKTLSSEFCLSHIVAEYVNVDENQNIFRIAKDALIIPVTNIWQKLGASTVKRVKTRIRWARKMNLSMDIAWKETLQCKLLLNYTLCEEYTALNNDILQILEWLN